jgi:hypothetical protein
VQKKARKGLFLWFTEAAPLSAPPPSQQAAQHAAHDFPANGRARGAHGTFDHHLRYTVALSTPGSGAAKQHVG